MNYRHSLICCLARCKDPLEHSCLSPGCNRLHTVRLDLGNQEQNIFLKTFLPSTLHYMNRYKKSHYNGSVWSIGTHQGTPCFATGHGAFYVQQWHRAEPNCPSYGNALILVTSLEPRHGPGGTCTRSANMTQRHTKKKNLQLTYYWCANI